MQISDIKSKINLKPQKLSVKETPHLTIEPNMTCNIKCRGCYNLYKDHVKSLDEVKAEIDIALKKRNLETITLLGGEPTLHPDLIEIISYIKSKHLICALITNGIVLLSDKEDCLLDEMIGVGLDRILLHVDLGQSHIHEDIEATRLVLFEKLERKKIFFSLSTTIYPDNQDEIPEIMKKYSRFKYFDGILSLLEKNSIRDFQKAPRPKTRPELIYQYHLISHELKIEPSAYIPSFRDDLHISWLMFFYYINARTKKSFCISPEFNRMFRKIYRRLAGRNVFGITSNPAYLPFTFLLTCLVDIIMHPSKMNSFFQLIWNSSWLNEIRFHYILLQDVPEYNGDWNKFHMCHHCPDATIRNGRLTPICVADLINPLGENSNQSKVHRDLRRLVYSCMEEI